MGAVTDIDFDKLILQLLPNRLRKVRFIALLTVFIAPLKALYTRFKTWEAKSIYDIKYQSGCVAHLEKVLNDVFDAVDKRIFIGEGTIPARNYLYLRAEDRPIYLNTIYLYNENDYLFGSFSFSINVPVALQGNIDEVRLRAVADRYKRDAKNYTIKYF